MSVKQINDGQEITYVATAAIASGDLIHIGNGIMGKAENDIANGATGTLSIRPQTITATTDATAIAAGAKFYLTTVANTISSATTSGTQILNWFCEQAVTTAVTSARITKL